MLTVGSLFSGIGGIDLGLERAGMTIKWQVENNAWCQKILTKHWPEVPKYDDVQTLDASTVEPVDVLAGGFPCQDLSVAGNRAGIAHGTRSGLWLEFAKLIRALRPRYVLVENVSGLLANHGLGTVLRDLAECGYDAEWQMLSARAFGANHLRKRVWVVAYPECKGSQGQWPEYRLFKAGKEKQISRSGWWAIEPPVGRVAYGVPKRVDRLRGLGNAVVPHICHVIGSLIVKHDQHARRLALTT